MNNKSNGWVGLAQNSKGWDNPLNDYGMGQKIFSLLGMNPQDAGGLFGTVFPLGWAEQFNPSGSNGGGTSPPPPPPPPDGGGGGTPGVPRWAFPEYTQNWAFTPPAPFYTAPPPVFDKKNYPTTTTKK